MTRDGVIAGCVIPGLIGLMLALDVGLAGWLRISGLGVLLISVLVVIYTAFVGVALIKVLARGVIVLVPVLGVIGLAVLAILQTDLDLRLKQALLAGAVVVSGWIVTFLIQESRMAEEKRSTRIDVLLSLQAEIENYIGKQEEIPFADRRKTLNDAAETDEEFLPFFFREARPVVFSSVADRMPLLAEGSVFWLVRFYAQIEDIVQMSADLNEAAFKSRPKPARVGSYLRLIDMRERAAELGRIALGEIEKELNTLGYKGDGPDAA